MILGGCPGSSSFKQPTPEEIKCSYCGQKVEIWSDEVEVLCPKCKNKIEREDAPSCLDWCQLAKECVGQEKYNKYLRNKQILKERDSKKG